jgi:hypothetical protein
VAEREYWDDYQQAFSEMLSHTSTEWAPWYVIPADHKWFARIAAGAVIAHTLIELDPRYPVVSDEARADLAKVKEALVESAPKGAAADPFEEEQERKAQPGSPKQGKHKGKHKGRHKHEHEAEHEQAAEPEPKPEPESEPEPVATATDDGKGST